MATTERDFNLATIWGSSAETTIPGTPAQGTAYRDTSANFSTGFQFLSKSPSEIANQFMWVTAKTIAQLQTQGTLSYLSTTTYAKGALCYVTDGSTIGQYVSLENNNTGNDPLLSPTKWSPIAPIVSWNTRAATGACSIGDLQLRWGVIYNGGTQYTHNTEHTVTWSSPFANDCFIVMMTQYTPSGETGRHCIPTVKTRNKTTMTWIPQNDSCEGAFYIALGY